MHLSHIYVARRIRAFQLPGRLHFHQEGIPAHETTPSIIYPIRSRGGLASLLGGEGCGALFSRALVGSCIEVE